MIECVFTLLTLNKEMEEKVYGERESITTSDVDDFDFVVWTLQPQKREMDFSSACDSINEIHQYIYLIC